MPRGVREKRRELLLEAHKPEHLFLEAQKATGGMANQEERKLRTAVAEST